MWRSKPALITTTLYIICITAAIIANLRGTDSEGVYMGQVLFGMPWVLLLVKLHINAWYPLYVYAVL